VESRRAGAIRRTKMSRKKLIPSGKLIYIACYKGKEIASSADFKSLANKANVKVLLGDKDLVIKHNVPEGLIAIY
jgi:hypothetical protein